MENTLKYNRNIFPPQQRIIHLLFLPGQSILTLLSLLFGHFYEAGPIYSIVGQESKRVRRIKKKKNIVIIIVLLLFTFTFAIINNHNNKIQESITYFPIDPKVAFKEVSTSIRLVKATPHEKFKINWKTYSILDRTAYLRQDVSLLFINGRLAGKQAKWKQNTSILTQEDQVSGKNSATLQALTFHYAELHENENHIFSSQQMSADRLYIIHSPIIRMHSFRIPQSAEEKEWKEELDKQTSQLLEHSFAKGIKYFSINPSEYTAIKLTELHSIKIFPGFTGTETKRIMGNLWEGLYKNYFLGIRKADGNRINPIGSTIPVILLAKDKTHLLVLTQTAKEEPTLLRQLIEVDR